MPPTYHAQCWGLRMQRLRPDIMIKWTVVVSNSVYSNLTQLSVRGIRGRWDGEAQRRLCRDHG